MKKFKELLFSLFVLLFCIKALYANNINENDFVDKGTITPPDKNIAIMMMNYLTVKSEEVSETKNRIILDDIYNMLQDNMRLTSVDTKTQAYLKNIKNSIFQLKMNDIKRERIEFIYEQNKAQSIRSAIPNPLALLSSVRSWNIFGLVSSGAYMVVDSVAGYQRAMDNANMQYLKSGWEIEDNQLTQINTLKNDLFDYKANMVRDNKIDEEYIMYKEQVNDFVKWKNEKNVVSRIDHFETHKSEYAGYPIYHLILAQSYFDNEQYQKCIESIDNYYNSNVNIFTKDRDFAKAIPFGIASAEKVLSKQQYIEFANKYLPIIEKNIGNNDFELQYFLASIYADLYLKTNSYEYLQKGYEKAKDNVNNLVEEQMKLNSDFLKEYEEVKPSDTATKKEKEDIKEYNKVRKKEKKTELPQINETLNLNCELLFQFAEKKNIDNKEKEKINTILHAQHEVNGEDWSGLFLLFPLNDLYYYKEVDKDFDETFDYADYIECSGDILHVPFYFICDTWSIKVIYSDSQGSMEYSDWYISEVDRKNDVVVLFPNDSGYKFKEDTKVHVEIVPRQESDCKPIIADYKIIKHKIGLFDEYERIK